MGVDGCGTGGSKVGVCGKTATVAREQDLLLYAVMGISQYTSAAFKLGAADAVLDRFAASSTFATLTNVNFSEERFVDLVHEADTMIVRAKKLYESACAAKGVKPQTLPGPAQWRLATHDAAHMAVEARDVAGDFLTRRAKYGADVAGMQELLFYGIKGVAAYSDHAQRLGRESAEVYAEVRDALAYLATEPTDMGQLVAASLKFGGTALKVMALLSDAHTSTFGHPVPTKVPTHQRMGKAIVISGHDLKDLALLLEQCAGTDVSVYTHGEMLPGHGYPGLNKSPNLAGHYGGAWQLQQAEFSAFKGPIIMTSNCILEPRKSYRDRIYTCNATGYPGVKHIANGDFRAVIAQAQAMEGYTKPPAVEHHMLTGFGHNAVLGVADKIVDAVKSGALKHFFVIGGCDGSEGERNYFKDIALAAPKDTVVLTLACGKFRFNKYQDSFGTIGGIPRLLDLGQCNDAHSGIQVALALKNAFGANSVNDLPLSFVVSWMEQKAVAVLLALLHLGIRNIRLGPRLPAFATPAMLSLLAKEFNLKPVGNVQEDLKQMLLKN